MTPLQRVEKVNNGSLLLRITYEMCRIIHPFCRNWLPSNLHPVFKMLSMVLVGLVIFLYATIMFLPRLIWFITMTVTEAAKTVPCILKEES
jgi:hypothetical protein